MRRERPAEGRPPRGAFELACRYLTACERCAAQVRTYLERRGLPAPEIEEALARLREQHLVDDLRYARLYVESRSRRSPRSGSYLVRELLERGVDGETARRTVAEFLQGIPEEELARRLLEKLPAGAEGFREKAARRLRARGFRPSIALGAARAEDEEEEGRGRTAEQENDVERESEGTDR